MERAGEYEWRGEAEQAELVLFSEDDALANRLARAADLPGIEGPVFGAASGERLGWTLSSVSHVSPELFSAPEFCLLEICSTPVESLGVEARDLPRLLLRNLSEARLPAFAVSEVGAVCESGARWAAGEGLLEEGDLSYFPVFDGSPDALGRRALTAAARDLGELSPSIAIRQADGEDEELGICRGAVALVVRAGCGEAGRMALAAHRGRIAARGFTEPGAPVSAPLESEEASDLLAATAALYNLAAVRAAVALYALRGAMAGVVGEIETVAGWPAGGLEIEEAVARHRHGLAAVEVGEAFVCSDYVCSATGEMAGSAPEFGDAGVWQEAGLAERRVELRALR